MKECDLCDDPAVNTVASVGGMQLNLCEEHTDEDVINEEVQKSLYRLQQSGQLIKYKNRYYVPEKLPKEAQQ